MDQWLLLVEIILINMVLSGDNAVVIAMASQKLPKHQQKCAMWWGASIAVVLRILLTFAAVLLLKIPLLQAAGGLLLFYIAFKLLSDDHDAAQVKTATSLGSAIRTILLADFIMSLDNVIAIAAIAKGDTLLIVLGVASSIPLIIWGSAFIMKWMQRVPLLTYLGASILAYTAGEMFAKDKQIIYWFRHAHESFHWAIPVVFVLIVLMSGGIFRSLAAKS